MAHEWAGNREFLNKFEQINLFAANNNFGLKKQSSQKSWTRLLKLLAKTLKNMCEWIHF